MFLFLENVHIHAEADDVVEGVTSLEVEGISMSLSRSAVRKALAVSDVTFGVL